MRHEFIDDLAMACPEDCDGEACSFIGCNKQIDSRVVHSFKELYSYAIRDKNDWYEVFRREKGFGLSYKGLSACLFFCIWVDLDRDDNITFKYWTHNNNNRLNIRDESLNIEDAKQWINDLERLKEKLYKGIEEHINYLVEVGV